LLRQVEALAEAIATKGDPDLHQAAVDLMKAPSRMIPEQRRATDDEVVEAMLVVVAPMMKEDRNHSLVFERTREMLVLLSTHQN
jgi:hypothetical protein